MVIIQIQNSKLRKPDLIWVSNKVGQVKTRLKSANIGWRSPRNVKEAIIPRWICLDSDEVSGTNSSALAPKSLSNALKSTVDSMLITSN